MNYVCESECGDEWLIVIKATEYLHLNSICTLRLILTRVVCLVTAHSLFKQKEKTDIAASNVLYCCLAWKKKDGNKTLN